MAINEVIRTSGDVRRLIAQSMVEVKAGELSTDKGQTIAALGKVLNENIMAEIAVAKVSAGLLEAGKNLGEFTAMGKLIINDDSTPTLSGQ